VNEANTREGSLGAIGLHGVAEDRTGDLSRARGHEGRHLRGEHAIDSHYIGGCQKGGDDGKKVKSGENEVRMDVKQKVCWNFRISRGREKAWKIEDRNFFFIETEDRNLKAAGSLV